MSNVDRVHLIVHPGFIAESEEQLRELGKLPTGAGEIMRKRYIAKLNAVERSEIAIILLHHSVDELPCDLKRGKSYAELASEMQDILGDRLITVTQHGSVMDFDQLALDFGEASRIAGKRGFSFNRSTPTLAYGETLLCCVAECAEHMNVAGNFRDKTVVDAHCCDTDIPCGTSTAEVLSVLQELQMRFEHLKIEI